MMCPGCWTGSAVTCRCRPGSLTPGRRGNALAITEAAYGPDHPTVAASLNNLALILKDLGQAAGARPLQERALAIIEARRPLRGKNWSVRSGGRRPDTRP